MLVVPRTLTPNEVLLACDPGVHAVGWCAIASTGILSYGWAQEQDVPAAPDVIVALCHAVHMHRPTEVLIELPQVYSRQRKGDPNDLIDVAVIVGRILERFHANRVPTTLVRPHGWKGSTPKKISHARAFRQMTQAEKNGLPAHMLAALQTDRTRWEHNVWDAIAMALWKSGRGNG